MTEIAAPVDDRPRIPWDAFFFAPQSTAPMTLVRVLLNLFTWAAFAFEATFVFLVWPRRQRLWVLGAGVLFHLGIDTFLDIGFFSIAIYLAYLAFLPTDLADRIVVAREGERRRSAPMPLAVEPAE